jgi:site-specific recombinase XerD
MEFSLFFSEEEILMPRKTFRKVITTINSIEQINPDNKKIAESFLKEKDTRCSDKTVSGYKSDLDIFFVWNLENNGNKFFVDMKKMEFLDFFSYCTKDLKWGSARFNRMRSCLSSLGQFIEKFMDDTYPLYRNIVLKAIDGMPLNPNREKTILSEEQIQSLFSFLIKKEEYQDACLLALAISSGARLSELLRFTTEMIDEKNIVFNGLFLETTKKVKTKGRTKQGKMMNKYIIKDMFLSHYNHWLPIRERFMIKNKISHNFIFIKEDGSPAEEQSVRSWIKKWEDFLQVPFYMHSLRHYIVTHLTRLGLSADFIIEIMGWTSSEMYKIYNDLSAKDREWKELSKLEEHLSK